MVEYGEEVMAWDRDHLPRRAVKPAQADPVVGGVAVKLSGTPVASLTPSVS